jgi:hypothetical protein
MMSRSAGVHVRRSSRIASAIALASALGVSVLGVSAYAQRGSDFTRLEPGINISVRTNEAIDSARTDYRVYTGIVDEDVRGDDGRVAIPQGSRVELIVRRNQNNELSLDLESVLINGRRYAVRTDPNRVVGTSGTDSLIGMIVGAISGGQIDQNVRIPRDSVLNFQLQRALNVDVEDLGVDRDGYHYHDWYERNR